MGHRYCNGHPSAGFTSKILLVVLALIITASKTPGLLVEMWAVIFRQYNPFLPSLLQYNEMKSEIIIGAVPWAMTHDKGQMQDGKLCFRLKKNWRQSMNCNGEGCWTDRGSQTWKGGTRWHSKCFGIHCDHLGLQLIILYVYLDYFFNKLAPVSASFP